MFMWEPPTSAVRRAKLDASCSRPTPLSAAGNRSDDQQRLAPRRNRFRQRYIGWLMREILLTSKETQKRPALSRDVIAYGPSQHRIAELKGIEHQPQRRWCFNLERHLAPCLRQRSQMLREDDSNHGSVCTSTLSTAGKSRTIGFQLSPASAE